LEEIIKNNISNLNLIVKFKMFKNMYIKLKKMRPSLVFSLAVGVVGYISLVTLSTPTSAATIPSTCPQNLSAGSELKVAGKPAIFVSLVVNNQIQIRPFLDGYRYKSYKSNYGPYTYVTEECVRALAQPNQAPFGINHRPGSFIVKRDSDSQLYAVLPGNALAKISDATAKTLHGSQYKVRTLNLQEWNDYTCKKSDISNAVVYPGMTFRVQSDPSKVWYRDVQGKLREVASSVLGVNYITSEFIYTVPDSAIQGLSKGDMIVGTLPELTDRTQSNVDCSGNVTPPPTGNDTSAPTVTITAPQTGATVKDTVSYSANASDNVGVTKVQFMVDNSVVGEDTSAPYSIDWNTKNKANGNVTLQAKAFDAAGNSGLSPSITVKIDNTTTIPSNDDPYLKAFLDYDNEQIYLLGPNYDPTVFPLILSASKKAAEVKNLKFSWKGDGISGSQLSKNIDHLELFTQKPDIFTKGISENQKITCLDSDNTCYSEFQNLKFIVGVEESIRIYVRAVSKNGQTIRIGDMFNMSIKTDDIKAYVANSNTEVKVFGQNKEPNYVVSNSQPIQMIGWNVLASQLFASTTPVYVDKTLNNNPVYFVKIQNYGSKKITIDSISFSQAGSSKDVVSFNLYSTGLYSLGKKDIDAMLEVLNFDGSINEKQAEVLAKNKMDIDNFTSLKKVIDPNKTTYLILAVNDANSLASGKGFTLGLLKGKIKYSINESELGRDNNGDGDMTDIISNISANVNTELPQNVMIK